MLCTQCSPLSLQCRTYTFCGAVLSVWLPILQACNLSTHVWQSTTPMASACTSEDLGSHRQQEMCVSQHATLANNANRR